MTRISLDKQLGQSFGDFTKGIGEKKTSPIISDDFILRPFLRLKVDKERLVYLAYLNFKSKREIKLNKSQLTQSYPRAYFVLHNQRFSSCIIHISVGNNEHFFIIYNHSKTASTPSKSSGETKSDVSTLQLILYSFSFEL